MIGPLKGRAGACLLAGLACCLPASGAVADEIENLGLVALRDAVAWTSERHSAPMIAWLGDPDASVPWQEGAGLEEALFHISLGAPAMWDKRGEIYLLSVPPPHSVLPREAHLPGNLIRCRSILEGLSRDVLARVGQGDRIKAEDLSPRSVAHINALVRRLTARYDPANSRVQYEAALAQGEIGVEFRPTLSLCPPHLSGVPDNVIHLSTRGSEEVVAEDWPGTAGWAGWEAAEEVPRERLPEPAVAIAPGVYPLADLVFQIGNAAGAEIGVDPRYADRQVYLNVPDLAAGELLRLVADACYLNLLEAEDGVLVGTPIEHGDWLRMHRDNVAWLLEVLKPQTAFPRDSDAARFARVLLGGEEITVRTMPRSIQGKLRPQMIEGREGHVLKLYPGFDLCFYPPGSSGVSIICLR